jgi:hypothetical protein
VKLGAENRNKLIAAIVLMVLAVVMLSQWLFNSSGTPAATTSAASIAAPVTPAPGGLRAKPGPRKTAPRSLDPTLRDDWLQTSEGTKYEGSGRNIFQDQAEIPTPVAPGQTDKKADNTPPTPPPPPPPPPITLKFYGFASKPGEPKKIFLSQGEDIFVASEGEIIDRRYKILHIAPLSVEIEDVLNNNRQSIPLTQG